LAELFAGDFLPKNPYPTLFRSLNIKNVNTEIQDVFQQIKSAIKFRNEYPDVGNYGITVLESKKSLRRIGAELDAKSGEDGEDDEGIVGFDDEDQQPHFFYGLP
jgi:hypothetical protein